METEQTKVICAKCNEELAVKNVLFEYMGRKYSHEVPVCPVCGKVYITRELAEGRMKEVEIMLEDK